VTTAFDCLKSWSTTNFLDFSDLHAHVPVDMSDLVDFLSEYKTMAPLVIWHFHMLTLSVHSCTMDLDMRQEFSQVIPCPEHFTKTRNKKILIMKPLSASFLGLAVTRFNVNSFDISEPMGRSIDL